MQELCRIARPHVYRDRVNGFWRASKRHVQEIHPGSELEKLAGEMLGGGKAGARQDDFSRRGFGSSDQLHHAIGREIRARHDQEGAAGDLTDWRKGGAIVRHVFPRNRGDNLTRSHNSERVTVGLRTGDQFITQDSASARLVFNDHRLTQAILHRVSEYPPNDVGTPARSKLNDETDRLLRPTLRQSLRGGRNEAD